MITSQHITAKCLEITQKYGLGVEHFKDVMEVAQLTIQHCQERLVEAHRAVESPYEKPWGGIEP